MADKGISLRELDPRHRYKLLCGVIVPRPIALVTTLDENGAVNAAPFSFFTVFAESPVLIVLGLQHKPDHSPRRLPAERPRVRQSLHQRDTFALVRESHAQWLARTKELKDA